MVQYACQYISLLTLSYEGVWWRLYATEWANALALVELLFSLPVSNGTLERVFSQVNVIKSTKRTQLSNQTLDDLLIVSTAGAPLEEFKWKRPNRRPRARLHLLVQAHTRVNKFLMQSQILMLNQTVYFKAGTAR